MQEELISKKDLLSLTGISYGQLYRWKRQKLIPDEWFIKQAAVTGQETYFTREKILERVRFILDSKDKYSLDELAAILNPSHTSKLFAVAELKSHAELSAEWLESFAQIAGKDHLSLMEVVLLHVASEWQEQHSLEKMEWIQSMQKWLPHMENQAYICYLCKKQGKKFYLLTKQDTGVWVDAETILLERVDLEARAKVLHQRLNEAN